MEPMEFMQRPRLRGGRFWPGAQTPCRARRSRGSTPRQAQTVHRTVCVRARRLHLIRFHGVLAPNAKLRKAVVPVPTATVLTPAHIGDGAHTPTGSAKGRLRWAQLLKRVFDIDIERCPDCGGPLIAAIEEPAAITRILTHLGLAAQPPPRAPARRVDLFQAA